MYVCIYVYLTTERERKERFRLNMGLTSHRYCMLGDPNVCSFDISMRFVFGIAGRRSLESS